MNRTLVGTARKQLLRRGRILLRAGQAAQPDVLGSLPEAELAQLQEIHAALERIERGIFGRCDECQEEIEEERLARIPWERRCGVCRGEPLATERRATA